MRRSTTALMAALALATAMAVPALAAKPIGVCPNGQFEAMTYAGFLALSRSVGVPEEFLGADHFVAFQTFDKNHDGRVCIKTFPTRRGISAPGSSMPLTTRHTHKRKVCARRPRAPDALFAPLIPSQSPV